MRNNDKRIALHFCDGDRAVMEHDPASGRLLRVHRHDIATPIVTDQDGTTLIGVQKKRGARVFDRSRFLSAIDLTVKEIEDKQAEFRALKTAKTVATLRRVDRRYRFAGLMLLVASGTIIASFLAWLISR